MTQTIIVGSRESRLAVIQSEMIIQQIRQICPEADVQLVTMKTTGDKRLDVSLDKIGGKGVFVKELDQALREKRIDLAVHSLKDMPADIDDDLPVLAYSKRENPADALVLPVGVSLSDFQGPIGSSSARRKLQLKALYPEISVEPVRGNIQTRLRKLEEGTFGALVLAYAGLKRLELDGLAARVFRLDEMIPPAGQGILAVQGRKGEYGELAGCLNDALSGYAAAAERSFIRALGCGCTAPVAAYAETDGKTVTLRALYLDEPTGRKVSGDISGTVEEAEKLGADLAAKFIAKINSEVAT